MVTLEQVKEHLYITDTAHDQYLTDLIATAEEYVQDDLGAKFAEMPEVPKPVIHAVLFLVAHWYENREPVSSGAAKPTSIPLAYDSIILKYRNTTFC